MNSLLLTLTALLILVLSALFAAPLVIDWNDYRPVFETQAAKLLGRQVKVGGQVHLVLLPAPELRFDDIKVADQDGSFDKPFLEARSLEAWLNIGALLSGGIEARKIAILDPVLRLDLKPDGSGVVQAHAALGGGPTFVVGDSYIDGLATQRADVGARFIAFRPNLVDLKARGVEFNQAPEERPYGIDSGFRDPSGNGLRLTQVRELASA